ncbi:MAG: hypothetical protein IJZ86_00995 [Bacteroides sp.]|nr:hypothetical protein [Bacteroides sp.]
MEKGVKMDGELKPHQSLFHVASVVISCHISRYFISTPSEYLLEGVGVLCPVCPHFSATNVGKRVGRTEEKNEATRV